VRELSLTASVQKLLYKIPVRLAEMPAASPAAIVLCEPAVEMQMDISQEPFCAEIYRGNAGRVARGHRFVRACAVEMHMDISQEPLCAEIHRENVRLVGWTPVLREPAQSKCTWTFHNSHFSWKFTGKLPNATDTTSIEHRALTPTITTPQCGHAVWGKKTVLQIGPNKGRTKTNYCVMFFPKNSLENKSR